MSAEREDSVFQPRRRGLRLFLAVLAGWLVFFWWLLIYSGGVAVHHG